MISRNAREVGNHEKPVSGLSFILAPLFATVVEMNRELKQLNERVVVIAVLVAITASLAEFPIAHSTVSTAQDTVLSFIEHVLPLDASRYNKTLASYSVPTLPSIKGTTEEKVRYTLESDESVIRVICDVVNGNVMYCLLSVKNGSMISDRPYADVKDSAVSLVQKYQAFYRIDSADMISLLSGVDSTKNTTALLGNINLTISNTEFEHDKSTEICTVFTWGYVYDGCEYPGLSVTFINGVLQGLIDRSRVYTFGNTTVNVTKEQAIATAMKYIQNYSYKMPDGTWITDFNVTENRTVAYLSPAVRDSAVLEPCWEVMLYLNQTYPGSVFGLLVSVWANSGEVYSCNAQGEGGSYLPTNGDSGSELPETSPSPSSSFENGVAPVDISTIAIVAAAAAVVVIAASVIFIKKRSK